MRYVTTILAFCFVMSQAVSAQTNKEKIKSYKVAFITQELELTPQEAQQFWPVYNEYDNKLSILRTTHKAEVAKKRQKLNSLSDDEINAFTDSQIAFEQKELELKKEYHTKFKQVLPAIKVAKLYWAEENFKRELIKRLQGSK